ncbi:hypothetical protein I4300191C4_13220 [Solibaculum mannosilyticum]|nr:hypothetical protein BN3661_02002 [Eubacteriaceae bacterium CHKCI005]
MKLGRKLVAFLLVLTLVVAFCGFMASAANGHGEAKAYYENAKKVVASISACSCKPRNNTLSVYIRHQTYTGPMQTSSTVSETYTTGVRHSVTQSDPIYYATGNFSARCSSCGSHTFAIVA